MFKVVSSLGIHRWYKTAWEAWEEADKLANLGGWYQLDVEDKEGFSVDRDGARDE